MKLVSISPMKQTQIQQRDGSTKTLSFNEITLTDGIDTICGETSEGLTNQINSADPQVKLQLFEGAMYSVRFNIFSREYEKDGKKSYFTKVNIFQLFKMSWEWW